jgi:hypothetical protein
MLTERLEARRASGAHFGGQPAKNQRHQAMMMRELNQSLPIDTVPENFLDTSGKAPARIAPAAGQNQIEFGAENSGV